MGSLSQWKPLDSYLAFLRLVGTTYFIKYRSTYRGTKSPVTLFNSCIGTTIEDQHIQWLDKIRAHVWKKFRMNFTYHLHTLLSNYTGCKLLNMWAQASANKITTLPPTEYGWIKEDGGYNIQCDTEEHILIVRQRVSKFTRGCTCKGGCKSKRCGCKKNGQQCGPGCRCLNCENLLTSDTIQLELDHELGIAREVVILKVRTNAKLQAKVKSIVTVK